MILFYHFIVFLGMGCLFVYKSILFHTFFLCFSNLYFNHRIYVSCFLMFAMHFRYVMYANVYICAKSVLLMYLSCMYLYMAKMGILRM